MSRPLIVRVAVVLLLLAPIAEAHVDVRGQLEASLVTDDSPPVGGNNEVYFDLRPQLALAVAGSRYALQAAYTFLGQIHVDRDNEDTFGNRLELSGLFQLSPRATFLLTASFLEASLAGVTLLSPTAAPTVTAVPTGTAYFFDAREHAELALDLAPLWRFSLGSTFDALTPLQAPSPSGLTNSYDIDSVAALERSFTHDLAALRLRGDVIDYPEERGRVVASDGSVDPNGVVIADRGLLLLSLTPRWTHDFDRHLSSELEAGPLVALKLSTLGHGDALVGATPVGTIALHYVEDIYQIEVAYRRLVQANVFLGETFVTDWLSLRGSIPIPAPKLHLVFAASLGYQHSQLIDQPGTLDTLLADASLFWIPRDELQVFVRYQLVNEVGDPQAAVLLPSLTRNTFMVGVIGRLSTDKAAFLPVVTVTRADRGEPEPTTEPLR